jgi:TRAP transporter 4TM/12TM fusion protein
MLVIACVFSYFAFYAERIVLEAWEYAAPPIGVWLALVTWVIVMEAGRRAGGWPVFVIVAVFSLYPTFADTLPDVMAALSIPVQDVAMFHVMGEESLFGIPMQVFAQLVFGFLVFGVSLQYTGGGPFFINLAFALLGHKRGGPAKVSIFSSGLMGSMSGGPISNVLTTGPLSIPAMQRIGFTREYAAGVEACASTGGVLMPPIMGATAFVMASFLNISYVTVAIAAIVPSLLYFFGLFMQIDAHAARDNLQGLPKEELPKVGAVFRDGWYFIAVFAALIWMLVLCSEKPSRRSMPPRYYS